MEATVDETAREIAIVTTTDAGERGSCFETTAVSLCSPLIHRNLTISGAVLRLPTIVPVSANAACPQPGTGGTGRVIEIVNEGIARALVPNGRALQKMSKPAGLSFVTLIIFYFSKADGNKNALHLKKRKVIH